ncbi:MAG: phosphatidylglycerophosphatase A [Gammaproteobacteria bacterium]
MNNNPTWKTILSNPIHLIAFGFGSGLAPKAPGTFGTLVAIPLYLLLEPLSLINFLLVVTLLSLFSFYIAGKSAEILGIHDHGGIVIDEICGYLITMTLAPAGWQWIIIGFVLFRIFDIWKPWPINYLDKKVSGGVGIVLDDLMAGIYALLSLELIVWLVN